MGPMTGPVDIVPTPTVVRRPGSGACVGMARRRMWTSTGSFTSWGPQKFHRGLLGLHKFLGGQAGQAGAYAAESAWQRGVHGFVAHALPVRWSILLRWHYLNPTAYTVYDPFKSF